MLGFGSAPLEPVIPTLLIVSGTGTALAVLALSGVKDAPLADLGTTLLGGYSIQLGWGDGRANLVAMQAVLSLFQIGRAHV